MDDRVVKIGSETAYDALEDALGAVVRLCSSPCTLEEVARAQGTTDLDSLSRKLDQLVKSGVLRKQGDRYEASASMVYAERREGVISIVTRIVLPNLMRMMHEGQGFAIQLDLDVPSEEQRGLRRGIIERLAQDLNEISDEAAADKQHCTFIAMGTSDVPPAGEMESRLIETVRRTGRQRAMPSSADRAFFVQFDAYFAKSAMERAQARIHAAARELEAFRAGEKKASYTVAFGFCARSEDGGE